MTDINRYYQNGSALMSDNDNGYLVYYEDHAKEVNELNAVIIRLARLAWRRRPKDEVEAPPNRLIELARKGEIE